MSIRLKNLYSDRKNRFLALGENIRFWAWPELKK